MQHRMQENWPNATVPLEPQCCLAVSSPPQRADMLISRPTASRAPSPAAKYLAHAAAGRDWSGTVLERKTVPFHAKTVPFRSVPPGLQIQTVPFRSVPPSKPFRSVPFHPAPKNKPFRSVPFHRSSGTERNGTERNGLFLEPGGTERNGTVFAWNGTERNGLFF